MCVCVGGGEALVVSQPPSASPQGPEALRVSVVQPFSCFEDKSQASGAAGPGRCVSLESEFVPVALALWMGIDGPDLAALMFFYLKRSPNPGGPHWLYLLWLGAQRQPWRVSAVPGTGDGLPRDPPATPVLAFLCP